MQPAFQAKNGDGKLLQNHRIFLKNIKITNAIFTNFLLQTYSYFIKKRLFYSFSQYTFIKKIDTKTIKSSFQ